MNKGPNQKNFENRPLLELNFSPENTPIMSIGPIETHTLIIPIGPYELNEGLYRVS